MTSSFIRPCKTHSDLGSRSDTECSTFFPGRSFSKWVSSEGIKRDEECTELWYHVWGGEVSCPGSRAAVSYFPLVCEGNMGGTLPLKDCPLVCIFTAFRTMGRWSQMGLLATALTDTLEIEQATSQTKSTSAKKPSSKAPAVTDWYPQHSLMHTPKRVTLL